MRAASTAAIAQQIARSRISSANSSRRCAGSNFESRSPRIRCAGSRITAAATTGPNSDPRPTSSTPATRFAPAAQARFSKLRVQRSFFNRRNLAAEAEMPSSFEVDLEPDLDTESAQHLRRRRRAKQEQKFSVAVPSTQREKLNWVLGTGNWVLHYCCSTSFSRAALPLSSRR